MYLFSYEPELFPGLIYRMVKPKIVLLIFVSGKVVLTGRSCYKGNIMSLLYCKHIISFVWTDLSFHHVCWCFRSKGALADTRSFWEHLSNFKRIQKDVILLLILMRQILNFVCTALQSIYIITWLVVSEGSYNNVCIGLLSVHFCTYLV